MYPEDTERVSPAEDDEGEDVHGAVRQSGWSCLHGSWSLSCNIGNALNKSFKRILNNIVQINNILAAQI